MVRINFWRLRNLGKNQAIREIVKHIFDILYWDGRVISIGRGPLSGYKWVCDQRHQFWMPLGLYEKETSAWLERQIEPGMLFLDIGANAGYFTLLGSKCVGEGRVFAFEPIPANVKAINANLGVNNIGNVSIEEVAVCNKTGVADFAIERANANSHLADITSPHVQTSPVRVQEVTTIKLDDFIDQNRIKPDIIKIDVEGAEMSVLEGALRTIQGSRPICIVSTHSEQLCFRCQEFFEENGYEVRPLEDFQHELCCYPKISSP